MRPLGKLKPLFFSAARTRSRDSFTDASGRPTISNIGMPLARLTSAVTVKPSMPLRPQLVMLASMASASSITI